MCTAVSAARAAPKRSAPAPHLSCAAEKAHLPPRLWTWGHEHVSRIQVGKLSWNGCFTKLRMAPRVAFYVEKSVWYP